MVWADLILCQTYLRLNSTSHILSVCMESINGTRSTDESCMHPNRRPFYALHSWLIYGPKSMSKTFMLFPSIAHPFTSSEERNLRLLFRNVSILFCADGCENEIVEKISNKKSLNSSQVNFFVYLLWAVTNRIKWFKNEINLFFLGWCAWEKMGSLYAKKVIVEQEVYTAVEKRVWNPPTLLWRIDFADAECWMLNADVKSFGTKSQNDPTNSCVIVLTLCSFWPNKLLCKFDNVAFLPLARPTQATSLDMNLKTKWIQLEIGKSELCLLSHLTMLHIYLLVGVCVFVYKVWQKLWSDCLENSIRKNARAVYSIRYFGLSFHVGSLKNLRTIFHCSTTFRSHTIILNQLQKKWTTNPRLCFSQ